jgi:hypothetical protein
MGSIVRRAFAIMALGLLAQLAFLPACHAVGDCLNCDPETEYCSRWIGAGDIGSPCDKERYCLPLPSMCTPNPTCDCLTAALNPGLGPGDRWTCSGDPQTGLSQTLEESGC